MADHYVPALEELYLLRHPICRFRANHRQGVARFLAAHTGNKPVSRAGAWFYFPWLHQLVHYLPEPLHLELKTGRNRNLITKDEQDRYYQARVAVLGLSVGSHVALTLAMTGGAKYMTLADPDVISGSNLNRIRAGFPTVGLSKVVSVARQIYEMNPYAEITIYPEGVTDANIENMVCGEPTLDLLIEEMDNPYYKLKVREFTSQAGIPVIMAADNGDNSVVDVERYDRDRSYPILHGLMGSVTADDLKTIAPQALPRTVAKMAGAELATPRMQQSVLEVGRSLYSWPQLGTAATLCGATLSYLARQIILGAKVRSGRYEVRLDAIFEPDYGSVKQRRARQRDTTRFLKRLGLPSRKETAPHG
jgi:molybdopterin/thiamine biosynthesis adenylyltransferase